MQGPGYTTCVGKIPEAEAETEYPGIQEEKREIKLHVILGRRELAGKGDRRDRE